MDTSAILRTAADRVRRGWIQFVREDADGRVCALGALDVAIREHRGDDVAFPWSWPFAEMCYPVVVDALAALLPSDPFESQLPHCSRLAGRIAAWNNAEDQTAENVALTLELAAVMVEQQASDVRAAAKACSVV